VRPRDSGLLSSPLRDRFGQHFHLDFYNHDELGEIVRRSAALLNVSIDEAGAHELASRSRGTPRIANRLLRACATSRRSMKAPVVTREIALAALELLEIDTAGFDKMDRAILGAIIDKFDGGPVGVESLAAAVGEESDTIEEVYERTCCRKDSSRAPSRAASPPSAPTRISAASAAALCFSDYGKIYILQHHPVENLGTIADALEGAALAWQ